MHTIVLISQDMVLISIVEKILNEYYRTVVFRDIRSALDYVYNSMPGLMVVDLDPEDGQTTETVTNLKEDPVFRQVPILALFDGGRALSSLWQKTMVDDFVFKPAVKDELLPRAELSILRSERAVEINPLTRLPGNIAINKQIQERLDRDTKFALAYADLDHFKPFNDYYGFVRGDEVLRMTGRLITNTVKGKQPQDSFVGHIGGDDYIFIMDPALVEEAGNEIIGAFDRIIPTFYDAEDRQRSFIRSLDRKGKTKSFRLITISIGIAHNRHRAFSHYGELAEVASEMKGYAKRHKGSCIKLDRREEHQ